MVFSERIDTILNLPELLYVSQPFVFSFFSFFFYFLFISITFLFHEKRHSGLCHRPFYRP